jgi:glycosyltransferase involved in cell wall biosynthesis
MRPLKMKKELSILIPVFNDVCLPLVQRLCVIAQATDGLTYEIIVADDGSTDSATVAQNEKIAALPHCTFVKRGRNVGRAAIRNFLAKEARYEWLLMIDCDVEIPDNDFITNYFDAAENYKVVCGGLAIGGDATTLRSNLRYVYEKANEAKLSALCRNKKPYQSFRTTNFFIERATMLQHPFDESIKTYGYEDVMFGKSLQDSGVKLLHIDNKVCYTIYEDNADYLKKTEEAMHTLYSLRESLAPYSVLIMTQMKIESCRLSGFVNLFFRCFRNLWCRNLLSQHPILAIYNLYRLGYYNSLCKK